LIGYAKKGGGGFSGGPRVPTAADDAEFRAELAAAKAASLTYSEGGLEHEEMVMDTGDTIDDNDDDDAEHDDDEHEHDDDH
jgi:hypothetical protein